MSDYIVNKIKDKNGNHEVHKTSCSFLPSKDNQYPLGEIDDEDLVLPIAVLHGFYDVDGCFYCLNKYHNS